MGSIQKQECSTNEGNNLEEFEYEIVEIVDVYDNYVDVKFLALVKGFKFVYKAQVEEE